MKIKVRLFATLREGREKEILMDSENSPSVLDILNILKINSQDVSILLINGRDGKLDSILSDCDVLSLFPPVGGG